MTFQNSEEYATACYQAAQALTEFANYTDDDTRGLDNWEAAWRWIVILLSNKLAGGDPDDDGGFRVTRTLY